MINKTKENTYINTLLVLVDRMTVVAPVSSSQKNFMQFVKMYRETACRLQPTPGSIWDEQLTPEQLCVSFYSPWIYMAMSYCAFKNTFLSFFTYVSQIEWSGIEHKIVMPAMTIPKLVCESWQYILPRQLWTNASWHQYELRKCISSLSSRSCLELSWLKSIKVCSDIMVQDMLQYLKGDEKKIKWHHPLSPMLYSAFSLQRRSNAFVAATWDSHEG